MFRNNYQGGPVVEIFSGQGKDPVVKWKLCGGPSFIHKEYNKEVRGFVYCLEGSSQTVKMQMPENGKMSLGLLQRFLVLQVHIEQCKDFSIELLITDLEHLKRRLYLSTVHKELSATHLHAKIPLVGLKRSVWSTLCIDLISFTSELFKGFLTLDGITLFATCKVRRIFTMKTVPSELSGDDMFLSGAGLMDSVPRSCQFPSDVNYVTQVLNMKNLRKADMRAGLLSSDCVPDQSTTARSTGYRRPRPQGVLHTASGSRVSGPPPQTGRKSRAASEEMDKSLLFVSNVASPSSKMNQKVAAESESSAKLRDHLSHGEPSQILLQGTLGSLQPHPPKDRVFDKQGSKKLRVYSAGREECSLRESSGSAPSPAEPLRRSIGPGLCRDLQVGSSWESNDGSEPQLTLQEEVFTFSSQPHSPKRGQGQGEQEKMEMGDDPVQSGRRYEAQPEDDFIGSESDEDNSFTKINHATSRSPSPYLDGQLEVHPESQNMDQTAPTELSPASTGMQSPSSGGAEAAEMAPTRCLSPSVTPRRQEHKCGPRGSDTLNQFADENSSVTLSRSLLHEVKLNASTQNKVISLKEEGANTVHPNDSSVYNLHPLSSLRTHGEDEEELRMLASLKREHEEDECKASGLSASLIQHCNVSVSMSSDDASTWTHISKPVNQDHHYQKEMNPLCQSNPRCYVQRQKMSRRPTTCFGSFVEPGINSPGRSDSLEKSVMEAKDGVDGRAQPSLNPSQPWEKVSQHMEQFGSNRRTG
ncbi:uncharacterized protein C3orf67 homolog isoform X3 [Gymnodraco acuticeps]|uniref:Uncharacterized protein C3orf67 homolog isoform X3 n=1 Tax=Gymnodraco acuticeps TaxID=8218 RepID=A0A6P8VDD7_GYMAC|nr:uncharacterized protein C3orf67 homolog isoform X3 [Gymnodraco acuticeps]